MTSTLFSPIRLAGLSLDNRIVVPPMCQYSADDGCMSDWHIAHLGMLANSGASLVVVEATAVERRGRITHGCTGLYSDACEDAMAHVLAICKRIGTAKFGIQIAHAGRKASSQMPWAGGRALQPDGDPWETVAASAIPNGPGWHVPREATVSDIERIRDNFVGAAQRALRAGFDEIELHMAHGYLLHTFYSPIGNRRTDEFGGSMENRMRFPRLVARAVRAVVPKEVPLGARITGMDWVEGGWTPDDAVILAKALKEDGLDFLCLSSGNISTDSRVGYAPGFQVPFADKVRREAGIPVRAVGMITTPQQAEAIVAEGKADQVAIGRAMLDNPHWGWAAARELGGEAKRPNQYARVSPKIWTAETARRP